MLSQKHRKWLRSSERYRSRGGKSLWEVVARKELLIASQLYHEFCTDRQGWTLDLGSGSGGIWQFTTPPQKLIALDYAPQIASLKTYPYRLTADACLIPFKNGSISVILALGLLEYIDDLDATFREWRQACRTGGRLLLTNSPPSLPNKLRCWFQLGAIPRPDELIIAALGRQGWKVISKSKKSAGWQSMLVAEAVNLQENT